MSSGEKPSWFNRLLLAVGGLAGIVAILALILQGTDYIVGQKTEATVASIQIDQRSLLATLVALGSTNPSNGTEIAEIRSTISAQDDLIAALTGIPILATATLEFTVEAPIISFPTDTVDLTDALPTESPAPTYTIAPTDTPPPTETPVPTDTAAPTDTPPPTNTSVPTDTPPLPTETLTPTPLPLPELIDSFNTGIRPEWEMEEDDAWASVNGKLTNLKTGPALIVGDEDWTDFLLSIDIVQLTAPCYLAIVADDNGDGRVDRHFSLRLRGSGLFWRTPGSSNAMPGTSVDNLETPYNLKLNIRANGSIATLINDQPVLDLVLAGYTQGKISLSCGDERYASGSPGSTFDNLQISPLVIP